MEIGERCVAYSEAIKKLRNKLTLTQTEFGELLGVSFTAVNRCEAGKLKPTTKLKRKLAAYFKKYDIEIDE